MAYKKTVILCLRGTNKKLAAKYGCTEQYVGKCLRYEAYSELADNIRRDALSDFKGKKVQLDCL